jgi:hypothetical protein
MIPFAKRVSTGAPISSRLASPVNSQADSLCPPPNQHLPRKLLALTPLGLTVSNPPTQAEVQAIADKRDELINTLNA